MKNFSDSLKKAKYQLLALGLYCVTIFQCKSGIDSTNSFTSMDSLEDSETLIFGTPPCMEIYYLTKLIYFTLFSVYVKLKTNTNI